MTSITTITDISLKDLSDLLPKIGVDANKYSRGKALLVGGSQPYAGAIVLAARSCSTAGAGYTQIVTPADAVPNVRVLTPASIPVTKLHKITADLLEKAHVVLLGPGLMHHADNYKLLIDILKLCKVPVVLDAGALWEIAEILNKDSLGRNDHFIDIMEERRENNFDTILTPHMGELAKISGCTPHDLREIVEYTAELQTNYGFSVVAKGPNTLVALPYDPPLLYNIAPPTLSKAGSGDVLAGLITGFLAQGVVTHVAIRLALSVHALSATIASQNIHELSVDAESLIDNISSALLKISAK